MTLVVIVVVAYLSSTRIERSTSSVYANRLRAEMTADSGLAAAIHLLKDNTRYGNYITAMPAPLLSTHSALIRKSTGQPIPQLHLIRLNQMTTFN